MALSCRPCRDFGFEKKCRPFRGIIDGLEGARNAIVLIDGLEGPRNAIVLIDGLKGHRTNLVTKRRPEKAIVRTWTRSDGLKGHRTQHQATSRRLLDY